MKKFLSIICLGVLLQGCNYLDVIPDNVATLDHSFANDVTARNYLFTCYNGLPSENNIQNSPSFLSGDEFWSWEGFIKYSSFPDMYLPWMIARGDQNTNSPYLNIYEWGLWKTIRQCNTFMERVVSVPALDDWRCRQWIAEAKVIKAYCHFYLMRMYGPIPLVKENISIDADSETVRMKRNTWDDCVDYVVQLLDEAAQDLPIIVNNRIEDLGRITRPIALALKAKVLVTSASPQFNGNSYYTDFRNKDGEALFGPANPSKWERAAKACKEAIDLCVNEAGMQLYKYTTLSEVSEAAKMERTIRGSVTDHNWCDELIWGSVKEPGAIQKYVQAFLDPNADSGGIHIFQVLGVNMKVVKQIFTSRGIPMEEDPLWNGKNVETLRTAVSDEEGVIRGTTAELNFDREPRFYASLGFDRGVWYGNGKTDNNPYTLQGLYLQTANMSPGDNVCITGYWPKKLINMESAQVGKNTYSAKAYAYPILRLADLYLLYAESLNESQTTPSEEVYFYIDKVRERAGLKGVKESWSKYSINPTKPDTQEGMRDIIRRERLIELSLEGHRFWDLRRWLLAADYYSQPVTGWNITSKIPEDYYRETVLATQKFTAKDYLWPLSVSLLDKNPNLVQTIGW